MKEFNAKKVAQDIIIFIQEYYQKNNLKGAVIGLSGGKDSSVVAGLFTKALGKENVYGLWLPCHSKEVDKKDAFDLAKFLGIQISEFDLTKIYDNYLYQIKNGYSVNDNDLIDANINIKPRLRTLTLYYHAAMLSKINKGTYIVAGTSNKCELYVGYFTKGGDSVSDIQVLADLTVDEVIAIGKEIGVPLNLVNKTPDDGLSGKSDEDKLGVKYKDIAKVINKEPLDQDIYEKVQILHVRNLHKFNTPIFKNDNK